MPDMDEYLLRLPVGLSGPVAEAEGEVLVSDLDNYCDACGAPMTEPAVCRECGTVVEAVSALPCPASGETMLYHGRMGAHAVTCPGCGRGFALVKLWRPGPEGRELAGSVTFPAHDLPDIAPRRVVDDGPDVRRLRYGGVTSRRYQP